jgi:prevent-host-death family protein
MQEVNISELKARLSHYVRLAENGEEVLVKDRDRPVARLVSVSEPGRIPSIPPKYTREQAEEIIARIPRPDLSKMTPRAIKNAMRWVRQDRSERWLKK